MDTMHIDQVHFIGVGGVGMSGIARVAFDQGMRVSGTDLKESRYTKQLREAGIEDVTVVVGYKKEEFFYLEDAFGVDIVVNEDFDGTDINVQCGSTHLGPVRDLVAEIGNGGLSGGPLTDRSLEMVRYIHKKTEGRFPIIGVGGIMTEDDAVAMLEAGASLIEVYTGFIYNGPGFAKRICKRLKEEAVRKEHAAREAKAAESPDTRNTL